MTISNPLGRWIAAIDSLYMGPQGEAIALEELYPVAKRFTPAGARVLEVGCGYGRNLVALQEGPASLVVGCDIDFEELRKARTRLSARGSQTTVDLVQLVQQPRRSLPFRDDSFNLVVAWQVIEHVFGTEAKQSFVNECVRVLKSGGHLLIATPNRWFPVDYHDSGVPLAHWVLPIAAREWLAWKVRGHRYHPSEYVSLRDIQRTITRAPHVAKLTKVTHIYFASNFLHAWKSLGGTNVALKRAILVLLAPLHLLMSASGRSVDMLLPSLRIVWRIEKCANATPQVCGKVRKQAS